MTPDHLFLLKQNQELREKCAGLEKALKLQEEELERAYTHQRELQILCMSWMSDYDILKAKYEPTALVTS